jgi:adenylate cyclase
LKKEIKSTIRSTAIRGITSAVITAAFMFLVYFQGWRSIAAGLGIGFFTYLSLSIYSDTIVRKYLRKSNLFLLLLTNTITNVVIMLVIAWFFVGLFYLDGKFYILLRDMNNLFSSYFLIGIGFGLVLSMFFNFFSIVNNLIGGKTLGKIFIGRYRNPVEIRQVFMFLDIKSSTTIAEKTGHLKFLSLVNDFFYDVAEPVRKTKGEIYKYVGDEAIIT